MAGTYHQIHLHAVFAVKFRNAIIHQDLKEPLFGVIGNLINQAKCKTILVNGVEDHVHCLLGVKPVVSVSWLMQTVKAKSSKYVNDHRLAPARFEWQGGYGAFSFSNKSLDRLFRYVKNQEEHHRKQTFREEYIELLKEHEIEYDERYLFHDLI